jgi:predicted amidophosphoribosyltransferase
MEKYYEKKAIRNGAYRACKKCDAKLSRYNQSKLCSSCEKNISTSNRTSLLDMINEIS